MRFVYFFVLSWTFCIAINWLILLHLELFFSYSLCFPIRTAFPDFKCSLAQVLHFRDAEYLSWLGGSLLASSPAFLPFQSKEWILYAKYDEFGPQLARVGVPHGMTALRPGAADAMWSAVTTAWRPGSSAP